MPAARACVSTESIILPERLLNVTSNVTECPNFVHPHAPWCPALLFPADRRSYGQPLWLPFWLRQRRDRLQFVRVDDGVDTLNALAGEVE